MNKRTELARRKLMIGGATPTTPRTSAAPRIAPAVLRGSTTTTTTTTAAALGDGVPPLPQMQHGPFLAHAEMVSAAAVAGVVLETTTITTPEEEVMKGRQLSACLRF